MMKFFMDIIFYFVLIATPALLFDFYDVQRVISIGTSQ